MSDLLSKRLVIVTGKGGVGKSTVALALAMAAAESGKRAIVCEVASQERASRIFKHAAVGFTETELAPNLFGISIDPDESMREYVLLQLKVRAMRDLLFRSKIFNYLTAATPGLRELVTIGKIWELALDDRKVSKGERYDLVVLDAPATGHGVGFLQTPKTFANVAKVGPIAAQAQTLDRFICNKRKTGVAIVSLPEEMPVNETAALERDLREDVGAQVDAIILNGLYPQRFDGAETSRLEESLESGSGSDAARAAIRSAIREERRAASQREQLTRLRELTQTPVSTLPYLFAPELGGAEVRRLAAEVNV